MEKLRTSRNRPRHWALIGMLAVSLLYVYWPEQTRTEERLRLLAAIPTTIGAWTLEQEQTIPEAQLASLGAAEYVLRTYQRDGDKVLLYAAFFTGKHGALTHNPEKCYPAAGFTVTRKTARKISLGLPASSGDPFQAIRIVPVRDDEKMVVLYWFQEGNRVIVNKWEHIFRVLVNAIAYNRTESLMVRLSTAHTTDEEIPARTRLLEQFGDQVRVEVAKALQGRPS